MEIMSDLDALFDDVFLRKLDRLSLVVHKRRSGQFKGERRSTKRGTSVEFADYRNYSKGDDLRRVDWNIYARLERPFVKLFEEEEDLSVHLVLDASKSMDWGEGDGGESRANNKWDYARRIAAALGYIALGSGDRLTVTLLNENDDKGRADALTRFGPARSKGQALPLLRFLTERHTGGRTDLNQSLRRYALSARRPGLLILITDLFSPTGYKDGMSTLLAQGYEGLVLHILTPSEINPPLAGDLKLVDVESGHEQEVTIDSSMRNLYRQRLAAWQDEIGRWCGQRGVWYMPVTTDVPFDQVILFHMRRRGLVR
jgi:uncharacterized protein (DUF58 family)